MRTTLVTKIVPLQSNLLLRARDMQYLVIPDGIELFCPASSWMACLPEVFLNPRRGYGYRSHSPPSLIDPAGLEKDIGVRHVT